MKQRLAGLLTLGFALSLNAQVGITSLPSFGGGDGWLAPGEGGYTYLGTGNLERGLAFGNNHLYLVSRSGGSFIRILDPITGADLGQLSTTGISGGLFAVNTIGVGGDGAIYVNNLTTASSTTAFTVYRWANEGATPTVAYTGTAGLSGARVGDTLAVFGSGSSTRLAAGFNSNPAVTGNNGYSIIDPTAGTATAVGFTGTPAPTAGDFRLGLTFAGADQVIGTQGSSLYRYTSFAGNAGTLIASPLIPDPAGSTANRLLAYNVLAGVPLLAVQSIGDSHVSLYDLTDPANPVYLASGNNTVTPAANGNGTGQLAWGTAAYDPISGTWSQNLYALSSNQGIQAFVVTVPEPGALSFLALGALALVLRRRNT